MIEHLAGGGLPEQLIRELRNSLITTGNSIRNSKVLPSQRWLQLKCPPHPFRPLGDNQAKAMRARLLLLNEGKGADDQEELALRLIEAVVTPLSPSI